SLARLLLLAVKEARSTHQLSLPELLIPVPLHHRRQWQRGYNQSSLLARHLSRWLNIPCLENVVIRQRATSTQRGKNSRQREQNMQQAFALKQRLPAQIKRIDRKSTRLNSSHVSISYAVFCLKKKTQKR